MKLFALGCLATGALAKDIKQHKLKEKMMENRLKFDRDVIMNPGNGDEDEEWDPWDLEDEELQVRTWRPRTEFVQPVEIITVRLRSSDFAKSRKWPNKTEVYKTFIFDIRDFDIFECFLH